MAFQSAGWGPDRALRRDPQRSAVIVKAYNPARGHFTPRPGIPGDACWDASEELGDFLGNKCNPEGIFIVFYVIKRLLPGGI